MVVGSKKSLSQQMLNVKIAEALEDQKADFNAQIKGIFNLIVFLNGRIEKLENERAQKSFHNSMSKLPKPKILVSQERWRSASTVWR